MACSTVNFGDIDLVWGSNENSEGLDHIIEKHIKAHNDFDSVESAINGSVRKLGCNFIKWI